MIHSLNNSLKRLAVLSLNEILLIIATTIDGKSYTWNEAMAAYLYSKNEKALRAMLYGNFVNNTVDDTKLYNTPEEGMTAINKLVQLVAENDNIKAVADYLIQVFDDSYERIREAQIENFNTAMGKEKNYFPIFRLRHETSQGALDLFVESSLKDQGNQNLIPKLENGFTLERANVSDQMQQPILLDAFGAFYRGVHAQEYYAALGGTMSELTSALIRHGENGSVQELIKSRIGLPDWNALTSILIDAVKNHEMAEQDAGLEILNFIQRNRTISYLAGRADVWFGQTSSWFLGMHYAGVGHMFQSLGNLLSLWTQGRTTDFFENVYEKMPELRTTGGDYYQQGFAQELKYNRYAQRNPRTGRLITRYQTLLQKALSPNGFFDRVTKSLVFDAAYNSYLEHGYNEADAVRLARRVVYDTQPASNRWQSTRLMRSQRFKLLTQFTSALAPVFNVAVVDVIDALESKSWNQIKSAAVGFALAGVSVMWAQLWKDIFHGRWPTETDDEDEDEGAAVNLARWGAVTTLDGLAGSIPMLSTWYRAGRGYMKSGSYRNNDNPVLDPFASVLRGINYFGDDFYGERNADAWLNIGVCQVNCVMNF